MNYNDKYKSLPYFQVNAFTDDLFGGNPAGVVPLSEWPDDELMQLIAAENNLSETAFYVPQGDAVNKLRWFTPAVEVEFCGHATLATGFVILNIFNPELSKVTFRTQVGELSVSRGGSGFYVMNLPSLPPKPVKITPAHEALFSKKPKEIKESGMNFMCVFEGGEKEILALAPNFEAMKKFPEHGFIATSTGSRADFVSRYFAPNHGVPEDPVTGSAHSTMAPYWSKVLGQDRMTARQVSKRGGDMVIEMKGDRIDVWAKCFLFSQGVIHLK